MQGDTLATFLLILYLDYVLQTSIDLMKKMVSDLKNARGRRYPAETMTDADNLGLLANTPAQAESSLHSLAGGIDLYGNANESSAL